MAAPWRLGAGDTAPVQQSPVTCGAASLTVARMLLDADFARWVVSGESVRAGVPDSRTQAQRFGACERTVMDRTNALFGAGGRLNVPWPKALGTPPWGARLELEHGAARPGVPCRVALVRPYAAARLAAAHAALGGVVREGRPALLYVGNAWLPRHVTLVFAGDTTGALDVYDPATGSVRLLDADAFAGRRLGLGGWDVPWFLVRPEA